MLLKQSTARSVVVLMVDSSDHVTGKTGLSLTISASKNAAAFATITPTVTELSYGFYALDLTTTHTNTLGDLALHVTATGADPTDQTWQVVVDLPGVNVAASAATVAAAVWDEALSGHTTAGTSGKRLTDIATGTPPTAAAIRSEIDSNSTQLAAIKAKTDNLPSDPADASDIASAFTTVGAAIAAVPTATQNADALLKRDMSAVTGEAARSPLNALRWLRNKWGVSSGTLTVYKEDDASVAWSGAATQTPSDPTIAIDPA